MPDAAELARQLIQNAKGPPSADQMASSLIQQFKPHRTSAVKPMYARGEKQPDGSRPDDYKEAGRLLRVAQTEVPQPKPWHRRSFAGLLDPATDMAPIPGGQYRAVEEARSELKALGFDPDEEIPGAAPLAERLAARRINAPAEALREKAEAENIGLRAGGGAAGFGKTLYQAPLQAVFGGGQVLDAALAGYGVIGSAISGDPERQEFASKAATESVRDVGRVFARREEDQIGGLGQRATEASLGPVLKDDPNIERLGDSGLRAATEVTPYIMGAGSLAAQFTPADVVAEGLIRAFGKGVKAYRAGKEAKALTQAAEQAPEMGKSLDAMEAERVVREQPTVDLETMARKAPEGRTPDMEAFAPEGPPKPEDPLDIAAQQVREEQALASGQADLEAMRTPRRHKTEAATRSVRASILGAKDPAEASTIAYDAMRRGFDPNEVRKALEDRAKGVTPGTDRMAGEDFGTPREPDFESLLGRPEEPPSLKPAAPEAPPRVPEEGVAPPEPPGASQEVSEAWDSLPTDARRDFLESIGEKPTVRGTRAWDYLDDAQREKIARYYPEEAPGGGSVPAPAPELGSRPPEPLAEPPSPAPALPGGPERGAPSPATPPAREALPVEPPPRPPEQAAPPAKAPEVAPPQGPTPSKGKKAGAPTPKAIATYQRALRSKGKVSVKGDKIALDTSGPNYRVTVNGEEVFKGPPAEAFARADQEIEKAARGTTLGFSLGALEGLSPSQKSLAMKLARIAGGGAGGYGVAKYQEEPGEDPYKTAARRLLYSLVGASALGGAPKGWSKIRGGMESVGKKIPKDFSSVPVSPEFTDLRAGLRVEHALAESAARELARAVPRLKGDDLLVLNKYRKGELGSKEAYDAMLDRLTKSKGLRFANDLKESVETIRTVSREITRQLVELGGLSPETAKKYQDAFERRIFEQTSTPKGKWSPFGAKPNRPKVDPNLLREDSFTVDGNLSQERALEIFEATGIRQPGGPHESMLSLGNRRVLLQWEPTSEGKALRDAFETAAKQRGYDLTTSDPLTDEVRQMLGEVVDPRAAPFLSLAHAMKKMETLRFFKGLSAEGAGDAKGLWTDPAEIRPDLPDNTPYTTKDGQFVKVPDEPMWGSLRGKGVRADIHEALNELIIPESPFSAFIAEALSPWRAGKVNTPRGLNRNFLGNLKYAFQARTAPWNPVNMPHYARVGAKFAKAFATRSIEPLRDLMRRYHINIQDPATSLMDSDSDALIRRITGFGSKDRLHRVKAAGRLTGDILTGFAFSEGAGRVPGAVLSGGFGAGAGAVYGAVQGDEPGEILKKAGKGALAGAAINPLARGARRGYGMVDAFFKAAAGEIMTKEQGMGLGDARIKIREQFQNYDEASKMLRILAGRHRGSGASTLMQIVGNPFLQFYGEELRIAKNTFKNDPGRAVAGLMAIPVIEAGVVGTAGAFGYEMFKSPEEKKAFNANEPGSVPFRWDGKLSAFDIGPIVPGGEQIHDIADILRGGDPLTSDSLRKLGTVVLGSGPVITGVVDPVRMMMDKRPEDWRTGIPLQKPGEDLDLTTRFKGAARRATETALPPWAVGGTDFKRATEAGLTGFDEPERFKRGKLPKEQEPGKTALSLGLGFNVRDLDFGRIAYNLTGAYKSKLADVQEAYYRAIKEPSIATDPKRLLEVAERYIAETNRIVQAFVEEHGEKLPSK